MSDQSLQTLESMSQANWYNQWTKNQFSKYLKGFILEIGCGIGNFSIYLEKYGDLTAIDINEDYIRQAKKKVKKADVGLGDIEKGKYFFKDVKFNTIICINVLEHIKDDKKAISNMYNLLEEDGTLILLIPAHPFLYGEIDKSIGHFRRYTKKDISKKLQNENFTILKIRTLNFIGALGWFISGRILKNNIVDPQKIKIFNFFAPFLLWVEDLISPPIGTSFLIIAKKNT